ncbi:MAG: hypothetical protein KA521_00550 [Crocinitomicaceae bacterium]|nr:hypothetical protein [Crocinitomicaceae bacterium]
MKETFTNLTASELFATEIGVSGTPLPSNGPGRKNPTLKYGILLGLVSGSLLLGYYIYNYHKKKDTIKITGNEK